MEAQDVDEENETHVVGDDVHLTSSGGINLLDVAKEPHAFSLSYKRCDKCFKALKERNTRIQKRLDLKKDKDKKSSKAKDKKIMRLTKKCNILTAKLKLIEKAPRSIDEIDLDKFLADHVLKSKSDVNEVVDFATKGQVSNAGNGEIMNEDDTTIGNPLYTFDTGKFRFEDFAKEQVHNSKSRPQGRRYCKQLLEWCAAIYKESKSAYEKFASKSPELYLPSERTLQHMLSNKKKKTVDLYLSEGMSESQA